MKRCLFRLGAEVGVSEGNPGPASEPGSSFNLAVGEAEGGTEVAPGQGLGLLKGAWDSFPPIERSWVPRPKVKHWIHLAVFTVAGRRS